MMIIVQFVKRLWTVQRHELLIVVTCSIQTVFQNGSHEAYFAQTVVMIFAKQVLHKFKHHRYVKLVLEEGEPLVV